MGSGAIVNPGGYILTNDHVIENAQAIMVGLSDSRKFVARPVGRDPRTDLAVLEVDAPAPPPAARLGHSARLRAGVTDPPSLSRGLARLRPGGSVPVHAHRP